MKHYGDVNKINGAEVEPVDIITFGSPCQDLSVAGKRAGMQDGERSNLFFEAIRIIKEMREVTNDEYPKYAVWENVCFAAGTLVTCEGGYKPIERVFVGEKVKTLSGKYLPVVKVHKTKRQNVLNLSVSGGEDLVVTSNHPFYARQKTYDTGGRKTITDAQWTEAKDLTAKHLIAYRIDEPTLPEHFISETDAWILGRWLADGSVDLTKANPRIFISVGNAKLEEVRDKLRSLPYEFYENKPHDTVINFTFTSNEFYSLIAECGIGAGQKRVAPFIFALPHTLQQRVLEGYMSGDGYTRKRFNGIEITAATASRELAYGIARLIRNCYKTSANISCRPARNGLIDGRVIKANYPSYNITACIGGKSSQSFFDGEFVWQPVRSIRPLKEKQDVYNLSVLEDNTYAVNDIICHNCGAFSSNKGHDFHAVLEAFCSVKDDTVSIPEPYDKKRTRLVWNKAGEIVGDNYSIAWRTLDAQYWGVPQRRKRIYLVADFTGRRAGEILFKPEGLRGNLPQGDETGEGATTDAVGSVDGGVGAAGVVSKGNGDCFIMPERHMSLSVGGGQAGQGYPCVLHRSAGNGITVFSFDSLSSNSMKSSNPTSGCRAVEVAKCIDTAYPDPSKNQGGVAVVVLNDQGGSSMNVENEEISPTLRANSHQHEPVIALQGNGIDRADTAGCNGCGWRENESYTLNTVDRHAVCYGIDHVITTGGNCTAQGPCVYEDTQATLKAGGVHAVCFEPGAMVRDMGNRVWEEQSPTLRANMGDNQPAVCFDRATFNQGINAQYNFEVSEEGVVSTVVARGPSGVCYDARGNGDGERACYTMQRSDEYQACEVASTQSARQYKSATDLVVERKRKYIIRRLTPTECARLQGFPDFWGHLAPYDPADAEFWEDVRKTDLEIRGKKHRSVKSIEKWYEKLHTDSAEYRMWGNGIALPNVEYVLRGIAEHGAKTLGSLFDGSGGFPLAGVLNGIKPIWASEVAPYPIAVTKSIFKEAPNG